MECRCLLMESLCFVWSWHRSKCRWCKYLFWSGLIFQFCRWDIDLCQFLFWSIRAIELVFPLLALVAAVSIDYATLQYVHFYLDGTNIRHEAYNLEQGFPPKKVHFWIIKWWVDYRNSHKKDPNFTQNWLVLSLWELLFFCKLLGGTWK